MEAAQFLYNAVRQAAGVAAAAPSLSPALTESMCESPQHKGVGHNSVRALPPVTKLVVYELGTHFPDEPAFCPPDC